MRSKILVFVTACAAIVHQQSLAQSTKERWRCKATVVTKIEAGKEPISMLPPQPSPEPTLILKTRSLVNLDKVDYLFLTLQKESKSEVFVYVSSDKKYFAKLSYPEKDAEGYESMFVQWGPTAHPPQGVYFGLRCHPF